MNFSQDWFSSNIPNFENIRAILSGNEKFLEVGSFEGRSTCWILENMLSDTGAIVCVDTFKGGEEHSDLNLNNLRDTFNENINECQKPGQYVRVIDKKSYQALATLITEEQQFDFIYVDGNHMADEVMVDACLCFKLLKQGGIMLFDDYLWQDMPGLLHRPKLAVDLFVTLFSEKSNLIMIGHQVAIQKLTP